MNQIKRIACSAAAAFLGLILLGGVSTSYAAGTDALCYELHAVRDGEQLALQIIATEDITTAALNAALTYDRDVFALQSGEVANGFSLTINNEKGQVLISSDSEPEVKKGQALGTLFFAIQGELKENAEYEFRMNIEEAFGFDLEDYAWVPAEINTVYQTGGDSDEPQNETPATEPGEEPEEKDHYTVTYRDEDGTVLYTETVKTGESTVPPEVPAVDGKTVAGWTLDGTAFDFEKPIDGDVTLVVVRTVAEPENTADPENEAGTNTTPDTEPNGEKTGSKTASWLIPAAAAVVVCGGFLAIRGAKKGKREK